MIEVISRTDNCLLLVDWSVNDYIVRLQDRQLEFVFDNEGDARDFFLTIINKVRSIEEV